MVEVIVSTPTGKIALLWQSMVLLVHFTPASFNDLFIEMN